MTLHATREAEVDNWLRRGVLVDLYQVVREGIMVSEPRYSIKNIERFYLEARDGDVTNAGASIVWYERWKETGEQSLLDSIEKYNEDDVRSTQKLRDWLLTLRPHGIPWAQPRTVANSANLKPHSASRSPTPRFAWFHTAKLWLSHCQRTTKPGPLRRSPRN